MSSTSINESSSEQIHDKDLDLDDIALQSAGVLLAVNLNSWKVHAVSDNADDLLGISTDALMDEPIDKWFDDKQTAIFKNLCEDDFLAQRMRSQRLDFNIGDGEIRELECLAQRVGRYLVIELFNPQDTAFKSPESRSRFRDLIFHDADTSETTTEACRKIADRLQSSMSVNGVGIYSFDEFGNGHIVTLSNDGKYHFPEEGIRSERFTEVARKPLQESQVRFISNYEKDSIGYQLSEVANNNVDVSGAFLRAHPAEDEAYLSDFAPAKGFLVLPIIMEKRLWGIILCLNTDDFCPPLVDLRLFSFAAQMASMAVSRAEAIRRLDAFRDAQAFAAKVEFDARNEFNATETLKEILPDTLSALGFEMAKVNFGDVKFQVGIDDECSVDVKRFMAEQVDGITIVDQMASKELQIELSDSVCSEAAFLALSDSGDDFVFLGRRDFGLRETEDEPGNLQTPLRPLSRGYQIEALQPFRQSIQLLFRTERERHLAAEKLLSDVKSAKMRLEIVNTSRNTTISELAGSLAHELNQPLTAVMNFAKACQIELKNADAQIPEDILEMMGDTIDQAARAGELLSRLRRFIESGELSRTEEDVHELVQYACRLALDLSHAAEIDANWELDAEKTTVLADSVQFEQIVFNLVRNASDALSDIDEPRITIRTSNTDDGYVCIEIVDNGPGVPNEIVPQLFRPFASGRPDGMGMGLTISRKIVEAHGGHIEHTREDDQTVFSFTIPHVDPSAGL